MGIYMLCEYVNVLHNSKDKHNPFLKYMEH